MWIFNAAAFRDRAEALGLSMAAIARELHTPATTVRGWAQGRHRPTLGNIERLARILDCDPDALWKEVTDLTPGTTGAIPLTESQALILAVAVASVQHADADRLAADWMARLNPRDRQAIRERLILTPHWAWAWDKLVRLGEGTHPLQNYDIQVQLTPPPRKKGQVTA